jgi:hypothetical protein
MKTHTTHPKMRSVPKFEMPTVIPSPQRGEFKLKLESQVPSKQNPSTEESLVSEDFLDPKWVVL